MIRYSGFCDGFNGESVFGWVADSADYSRLARVRFVAENGASLLFGATVYRLDVCRALNREGIFGFSAPIKELLQLGRSFRIETEDGAPLESGSIELPECPRAPFIAHEAKEGVIFLHIQKTAGTTLRGVLEQQIDSSRRLPLYPQLPGVDLRRLISLPFTQRQMLKLVMGHTFFGVDRFCGLPMRYATVLRHPIERVRSHYRHHRRSSGLSMSLNGLELPLHVIVNEGLTEEFDNLQVRAVAGLASGDAPMGSISMDDVELALENIRRHFIAVGRTDTMATSLEPLFAWLDLDISALADLDRLNAAPENEVDDGCNLIDWDRVVQRHAPDMALYERAANCVQAQP
jgi:hypothetical protein